MSDTEKKTGSNFSGRVQVSPSHVLHEAVLQPQFEFELTHYLPFYLLLEKVFLLEAASLGIMTGQEISLVYDALDQISTSTLQANPTQNFSDISFAIENAVVELIDSAPTAWHVDKSRNDFQACCQRLFARQQLFASVSKISHLSRALLTLAEQSRTLPMPGYTHYQAAQVISPGFYFSAVNETVLSILRRLTNVYDDMNQCPLGAGAMSGLELGWDRQRMARRLGFDAPVQSALTCVSDRSWALQISFEFALLGNQLSRFCTDLSAWGSNEYGFIDLPDEFVSISSAMPQKRNFTILERIRGETGHLASLHLDFLIGQRNTPYTNLVEVSKEAGRYLGHLFQHMERVLTLFTLVIEHLTFHSDRMYLACEREYCGGFALANTLTLQDLIPYRKAQVIAGELIRNSVDAQTPPNALDIKMLRNIAKRHGYQLTVTSEQLRMLFDVRSNLEAKVSSGSAHPEQVQVVLSKQAQEYTILMEDWRLRETQVTEALYTLAQARPDPQTA